MLGELLRYLCRAGLTQIELGGAEDRERFFIAYPGIAPCLLT
jgi:hypothetical protein